MAGWLDQTSPADSQPVPDLSALAGKNDRAAAACSAPVTTNRTADRTHDGSAAASTRPTPAPGGVK